MANGGTAWRKIQIGPETTAGTAVAATSIWPGGGLVNDVREVKLVEEQIGIAQPTTRAYIPKLGAEVAFDPIEATFETLPHILEAGVAAQGTGVADGAGSDLIYTYTFPTTAVTTVKTYSLQGGDNQLVQLTDYAFVESFKISGSAGEGVMMEANWIGRDVVDGAFTAAQAVPTQVPSDYIVFGGSTLSIDAASGTIGTTPITGTLLSFELDVTTGWRPKFTNAAKEFDFAYWSKESFAASLKLVFEHNAAADGQRDLFEAATPRLLQLKFTGGAVTTAGTAYSNKTFIINAPGVYTAFEHGDSDGNATVEATAQIGYDLTAGAGLSLIVVNELATIS